jgi:uncharacterized membrane protein YbhN (UPF0104 family)
VQQRLRAPLLALSALVALLLLGAVLHTLDRGTLGALLAEVQPWALLATLGGFALNHLLRIVRWHLLLGAPVRPGVQVRICLVSFLAITLLPLRLGEAVRPALLAREGVPLPVSLAALAAERLLDLLALLVLLGLAAGSLPEGSLTVQGLDVVGATRHTAVLGVAVLGAGLLLCAWLGERLEPLPWLGPPLASLARATRALGGDPARALAGVGLTLGTWLSCILYVWCSMQTLPSLPGTWQAATLAWAGIIATLTALPTPGFFGSFEAGAAAALSLYGTPAAAASAWALGLHVAYTSFVAAMAAPALPLVQWAGSGVTR